MVDIHTHLLPNIDDGSPSEKISIQMLKNLQAEGVTDVFLTPHNNSVYAPSIKEMQQSFDAFCRLAKENGCSANLYLGQEPLLDPETDCKFDDSFMLTLGGSRYVLLEFSYSTFTNIPEVVYEFTLQGYLPIVAHVERYSYFNEEMAKKLRGFGGLVQVGADSIVGSSFQYFGKKVKKLLNLGLVDFVSSDYHHYREICLQKAYKQVCKKYGKEYADKIFTLNGQKIIEEIKSKGQN